MADRCRLNLIEEVPLIIPPVLTSLADRFVSTPTGFENIQRMANNGSIQMCISPSLSTKVFTSDDYCATYSEKGSDLITAGYSSATYGLAKSDSNFLVGGNSLVAISNALGNSWTATSLNTLWGGNFFINGIAYNGSIWMAVGNSGKVATSPDGINWTDRSAALASASWAAAGIKDVAWDGSNFVIVGSGSRIAYSANGSSWTSVVVTSLNTICWTGTNFIAAGASGVLRRSVDGVSWTTLTSLSGGSWGAVEVRAIGSWAGRTIVVGASGNIAHSDNEGTDWTVQSMATLGATNIGTDAYCLDYFNNKLCIGGYTVYAYEP